MTKNIVAFNTLNHRGYSYGSLGTVVLIYRGKNVMIFFMYVFEIIIPGYFLHWMYFPIFVEVINVISRINYFIIN